MTSHIATQQDFISFLGHAFPVGPQRESWCQTGTGQTNLTLS